MPTNIRIRRGNKANLPNSAPSGMPLWCEDTKELYIGTGNGIQIIHTYDADTVDGYHASSFLQAGNQFGIDENVELLPALRVIQMLGKGMPAGFLPCL